MEALQKTAFDPVRARLDGWAKIIAIGQCLDLHDSIYTAMLLDTVNDFVNGARYESDGVNAPDADSWATPREFITRDAGDCEDFAIAKYFTLTAAGIETDRLRILYAKIMPGRIAHMVLAFYSYPGDDPLILDNLTSHIKPLSKRDDLDATYAFNEARVWLYHDNQTPVDVCAASTIVRWRELLERVAAEAPPAVGALA